LTFANNVSRLLCMQTWTPEEIEKFRKDNKLSRRALGELLGVTGNCIYQWERGLREPSKTTKLLLSRIEQENEKGKEKHGKRHLQKRQRLVAKIL
jgi:DNA-binding transcriptional regulator YiaG